MPFKHEKFAAKVRERNTQHLEEGERIEYAIGGQNGPIHVSALFNLIDLGSRMTRKLETRLIVLTDRNFYVAYPGFWGQLEMKEVRAKWPRGEAASHLRMYGRGDRLEVDGEIVHFRLGTMKHVRDLVAAVTESEPSEQPPTAAEPGPSEHPASLAEPPNQPPS
jgi:hypothetical protein